MLINLRNALMAGKRLPYDNEIEFLESTGTQWIDTGTPIAYADKIELTFATTASGTQYIFGDSISGSSLYRWAQTSANKFAIMTGNGSTIGTPPSISTNTVYTARVENKVCYLNDIQFATIPNTDPSTPRTAHAYLFTWNAATITGGKCRVYSLKIYDENGNAIRDYIPVRKGTVGYLYDRVSGKLFGNAGTGDFVLGPDVVPVEWLQGTGTQYIDTGISGAEQNLIITAGVCFNAFNVYAGVIGNYASEPANCFRLILTGSNNGQAYATCGYKASSSHTITNFSLNAWHTVVLNGAEDRCFCDGVEFTRATRFSQGTANANTIKLFTTGSSPAGTKQFSAFKAELNGTSVRSFRPVRVGSGSTWEGAMMDVLTRRIYRNQGTGAFAYGNDLKYPIPAE